MKRVISIASITAALLATAPAIAGPFSFTPLLLATHDSHAAPALQMHEDAANADTALFELHEAAVPFLGPEFQSEGPDQVELAIEAPGYSDVFTIYFPRGSANLTLAAEDMVAMAAEAVRDYGHAEMWISARTSAGLRLSYGRADAIRDVLIQSDIPSTWIRLDDGGLEASLDRPESISEDMGI